MTHDEFIDFFIKIKRMSISERTAADYEKCLRRYLPCKAAVSELNIFAAQNIMLDMHYLSYATIRRNLVILNQYCKYAVKYGYMAKNPFTDVERPRKRVIDSLKDKVYSEDELRIIFKALSDENIFWQAFITLALDSGTRRGELLALRWCDVDFVTGYLQIAFAAYKLPFKDISIKEPKGRRSRNIKITADSLNLLRKLQITQKQNCLAAGVPWHKENYIFGAGIGVVPLSPCSPSHWWRRFLIRRGLPQKRLHDLRHTCATLLLKNGVDIMTVKNRLGHAALSTTMLYLHNNSQDQAVEAMSEIIKKAAATT